MLAAIEFIVVCIPILYKNTEIKYVCVCARLRMHARERESSVLHQFPVSCYCRNRTESDSRTVILGPEGHYISSRPAVVQTKLLISKIRIFTIKHFLVLIINGRF
jgi:hypothetical protein